MNHKYYMNQGESRSLHVLLDVAVLNHMRLKPELLAREKSTYVHLNRTSLDPVTLWGLKSPYIQRIHFSLSHTLLFAITLPLCELARSQHQQCKGNKGTGQAFRVLQLFPGSVWKLGKMEGTAHWEMVVKKGLQNNFPLCMFKCTPRMIYVCM